MNFLAAGPLEMRSLLFQTYAECGDCGEAFIIRCMGPLSRRERPNKGHLHAAKKMCPLSESTANRRWDYFSKTLFEMLCRQPSECAMCASTRQTPHLNFRCARSPFIITTTGRSPSPSLAACGKCAPFPLSVHPANDLNRPHSQLSKSKCVISTLWQYHRMERGRVPMFPTTDSPRFGFRAKMSNINVLITAI